MNLGKYFSEGYLKNLETTAKYPNRLKDKKKIEALYDLDEFGDHRREFHLIESKDILLAVGYNRIVYGDHGPYVEFDREHFKLELFPKFNTKCPQDAYYEWMTVHEDQNLKVYRQLREVRNLPNPPSPGFRGNRVEGYADYLTGKYYIDPYSIQIGAR